MHCYWGESDAVVRLQGDPASVADTKASQTTKYSEILEEGPAPETSFAGGVGVGWEPQRPGDCSGA